MFPATTYQLELSSSELYWLASAFGQLRLPLFKNPFAGFPSDRLQTVLDDGQVSLAKRGLILHRPGVGWQVERLAASLVRWLAEPEKALVIEVHQQDGIDRRAIAYPRDEAALFLEESAPLRFTLHSNAPGLLPTVKAFLNIPVDAHSPIDNLRIVQPEHLLALAWKSPKSAVNVLERVGLPHKEAAEITQHLEKISGSAILTHYKLEGDAMQTMDRQIVLWGEEGYWAGGISDEALITVPFHSSKSIHNFLKSQLY